MKVTIKIGLKQMGELENYGPIANEIVKAIGFSSEHLTSVPYVPHVKIRFEWIDVPEELAKWIKQNMNTVRHSVNIYLDHRSQGGG